MKNKFVEVEFTISAEEYKRMEQAIRELSFLRGKEVSLDDFIGELALSGIKKVKKEIVKAKNIAA